MRIFWGKMKNVSSYLFWENLDKLWKYYDKIFMNFKKIIWKKGTIVLIFDGIFE